MALNVGSAIVYLTGDSKGLSKTMADADKLVAGVLDGIVKSAEAIGLAIAGIAAVVAGGVGAAVVTFTELAGTMADMSAKTGLSTALLGELQYAAKLTGGDIGDLDTAMKGLSNVISAASEGNTAAIDTLKKLGIEVSSLKGLSPDEIFLKVLNAVAAIPDPMQKSAIATDVFGKSGRNLLPMLADGAEGLKKMREEADSFGLNVSEKDVAAGDEFGDTLDKIKAAAGGLSGKIASMLMPTLQRAADLILKGIKTISDNFPAIQRAMEPVLDYINLFFDALDAYIWRGDTDDFKLLWQYTALGLEIIWDKMTANNRLMWDNFTAAWKSCEPQLTTIYERFKKLLDDLTTLNRKHNDQELQDSTQHYSFMRMMLDSFWIEAGSIASAGLNLLAGEWGAAWTDLITGLSLVYNNVIRWYQSLWLSIKSTFAPFISWFNGAWDGMWDACYDWLTNVWDRIIDRATYYIDKLKGLWGEFTAWLGSLLGDNDGATYSAIAASAVPGYADGTLSAEGGLAWVGERGRELVNLPAGTRVYDHAASERLAAANQSGVSISGVTINIQGARDPAATAIAVEKKVLNMARQGINRGVVDARG